MHALMNPIRLKTVEIVRKEVTANTKCKARNFAFGVPKNGSVARLGK